MELDFLQALQGLHTPELDALMVGVTTLSDRSLVWLVLGCALIVPRRTRRAGASILIALAFCTLVVDFALKPLVARPRPFMLDAGVELLIPKPGGLSFPSGHSAKSFAAAAALAASLPADCRRFAAPAFLLAMLIACSRLYLFVHFPTDVLAGAAIGAALGIVAARVLRVLPHPSRSA